MKEIEKALENFSIPDIRSALYYLGRYVKQAESFDKYQKDLFEDDVLSAPSETVKSLTLNLIAKMEELAMKKAAEFNDKEFDYWMDLIAAIEDNIDPEPTSIQEEKALEQINLFVLPDNTNTK